MIETSVAGPAVRAEGVAAQIDMIETSVAASEAIGQTDVISRESNPVLTVETKQYPDGTTATGTAPLPDASPTVPAAYTDTNALLLELVAHTESLEASVAERIRETVAKLRVSLGL